MDKQKPFGVLSTFNNSVDHLLTNLDGYVIYDQSTEQKWVDLNAQAGALRRWNSGHSLGNFLEYIVEDYSGIPETVAFLKANVYPRHCTRDFFENNISNRFFTGLFFDPNIDTNRSVNDIPFPGMYLERNDSWYMEPHRHSHYCSLDQLCGELFEDYRPPHHVLFVPGACFIATRHQILRHSRELYELLFHLVTYRYFPDEAYIVERLFPTLFLGSYRIKKNLDLLLDRLLMSEPQAIGACANCSSHFRLSGLKKKYREANRKNR